MAELKPCPFCGGEADCNNSGFMKAGKQMWAVECLNCGMVTTFADTEQKAIEAWNKRTERPKGRWIETKNGFHCSNCKRKPGNHPTKRGVFLSDFCPNCGADMRGESDGNL